MTQHNEIKIFDAQQVRSVWDDTAEEWYFAVVDVVAALTDSVNPTDYIKKMRQRDPELAKGWGQIVTPPCNSDCRRQAKSELCHCQRNFPHYPVHPFTESGTFQIVDRSSCC